MESTLLNLLLPNLELLDLPGDSSGKGIHETDVLGDFEMGDLASAEFANLSIGRGLTRAKPDPGEDDETARLSARRDTPRHRGRKAR